MNTGARIALIVTGAFAALFASLLLVLGAVALWGDSQKDERGYVTTDTHRFEAGTRALTSENLDVDLDGAEWVFDETDFGRVTLDVESRAEKPVFVGIARTGDVSDYLRGVAHTEVSDVDYGGPFDDDFDADYHDRIGRGRPAPPAKSDIWVASAQGSGRQTLDWDVEDGDWSVVVMNADGSRGVDADVSAGAKVPFLDELGWSLVGGGGFALVIGVGLMVLGIRRPRNPSGTAPVGDAAPAAAA
jgi:hypothetical protein